LRLQSKYTFVVLTSIQKKTPSTFKNLNEMVVPVPMCSHQVPNGLPSNSQYVPQVPNSTSIWPFFNKEIESFFRFFFFGGVYTQEFTRILIYIYTFVVHIKSQIWLIVCMEGFLISYLSWLQIQSLVCAFILFAYWFYFNCAQNRKWKPIIFQSLPVRNRVGRVFDFVDNRWFWFSTLF